ncbi:MAG: methyltransferase domain-containing protein [Opitutae bacterium]|nr:methyltransferase domain-containing protein [Opitutae bacterium]
MADPITSTSTLGQKILKGLRDPRAIISHLRFLTDPERVRRVKRHGEWYYRYRGVLYPDYLNQGNAAEHIRSEALKYCTGQGLDIGADRWPFPGATPVYNEAHRNAYLLDDVSDGSQDYIHSSHCLEHLDRWQEALRLWVRKLKPGGHLFLYLPHEDMKLWNPGSPWVHDGHKWQPTHAVLKPFLESLGLQVVAFNPGHDHYWSFHLVARK